MAKYTTINTQLPLALVVAALLLAGCAGYSQGGVGAQAAGAGAQQAGGAGTGASGAQQTGGAGAAGGAGSGRAVFLISDAAAGMGSVTSIGVIVSSVSVHSAGSGWITVSSVPQAFDLMQLRSSGAQSLLADANLTSGKYDQIRLEISSVTVTDSSGSHTAKLPSGDLTIKGEFNVAANSTTSLSLDFLADKSLHVTGNGMYILAPVVHLQGKEGSDIQIDASAKDNVKVRGGSARIDIQVGMDEKGEVGENLSIPADANITIGGDDTISIVGTLMQGGDGKGKDEGNGKGNGESGNILVGIGSGELFSASLYAQSAVEIYPGSTTGASSDEVPNFNMATTQLADGSTKVTMTEKSGGQALSAVVPAGGSLYFYDANPGDDATGTDRFLQDDKLVVVGSNGYIVQG